VKGYFPKSDIKAATGLLRDLNSACVDGIQVDALEAGFAVFGLVEQERWSAETPEALLAGGQVVAGVWTAMQYNGGTGVACGTCAPVTVGAFDVADALAPGGVFGVVPGVPAKDYLFSQGDPTAVRWGIEPPGAWGDALPLGNALVYGFPIDGPGSGAALGNGFDFNIVPWHADPWEEAGDYLLVGTCADNGAFNSMVAHHSSLLPVGPGQGYCLVDDPSVAVSWGESAVQLASQVVPFWPQTLHASLFMGKSGTGKAREFSPFYDYDISPDARTEISQPWGGPTPVGVTICFTSDCGNFTFEWDTEEDVDLATKETLLISAKDNNGAWVSFESGWDIGAIPNLECEPAERGAAAVITCTCDAREGVTSPCTGVELSGLALNKPGGYRLCVESAGDAFGSGLYIEECTNSFHISPH